MKALALIAASILSTAVHAKVTLTCQVEFTSKAGRVVKCGEAALEWDPAWDGKTPDRSAQIGVGACRHVSLQIGDYGDGSSAHPHAYFLIVGLQRKDRGIGEATWLTFAESYPAKFELSPAFSDGTRSFKCEPSSRE